MRLLKYFFVNWKDGMKINKSHYIAQENAILYQQAQYAASLLNNHNYGILPPIQINGNEGKLFLSVDNEKQIRIRLQNCLAITRGGHILQFDERSLMNANQPELPVPNLTVPFNELTGRSSTFYIVVTIDPYNRVPYGLADPREQPVRIPFTIPTYHLSLVPEQDATEDLLGLYQMPVGKLKINQERFSLDEDYIPPCSAMNSHSGLIYLYEDIVNFYIEMEKNSLHIIQKILQKKQDNQKARIVKQLCEKVLALTASQIPILNTLTPNQPPVELISKVLIFARTVKNILDHHVGTGREDLLNYFRQNCDVGPGQLDAVMAAFINYEYNHIDISAGIEKISEFTKMLLGIWKKLNGAEFIGERNTTDIVIDATPIVPESNKAYSFLYEE